MGGDFHRNSLSIAVHNVGDRQAIRTALRKVNVKIVVCYSIAYLQAHLTMEHVSVVKNATSTISIQSKGSKVRRAREHFMSRAWTSFCSTSFGTQLQVYLKLCRTSKISHEFFPKLFTHVFLRFGFVSLFAIR